MAQEIRTVFENGVFRPLDPSVRPTEGEVFVVIPAAISSSAAADELRTQRESLLALFREAEELPMEVTDDPFSGGDHDETLYGDPA